MKSRNELLNIQYRYRLSTYYIYGCVGVFDLCTYLYVH